MNRKVPARLRKLMKELKEGLIRIYGDQLKAAELLVYKGKAEIAVGRAYYGWLAGRLHARKQ